MTHTFFFYLSPTGDPVTFFPAPVPFTSSDDRSIFFTYFMPAFRVRRFFCTGRSPSSIFFPVRKHTLPFFSQVSYFPRLVSPFLSVWEKFCIFLPPLIFPFIKSLPAYFFFLSRLFPPTCVMFLCVLFPQRRYLLSHRFFFFPPCFMPCSHPLLRRVFFLPLCYTFFPPPPF